MSEFQVLILQSSRRRRGRPPTFGVRADERVTIAITSTQKAELVQVARDEQMKVSEVIRAAVDEFVGDYREKKVFSPQQHKRIESC